jgi:hypothetical protein
MMRTLAILNLGVLGFFAMASASEASIQLQRGCANGQARMGLQQVGGVSEGNVGTRSDLAIYGIEIPGLFEGGEFYRIGSVAMEAISASDLLGVGWNDERSDPPAVAIWSLLALCVAGGKCRLPQRVLDAARASMSKNALSQRGADRGSRRNQRGRAARAPWSEEVRAAVRQIIARDCPR